MGLDEEIKKQKAKNRLLKNKGESQKVYNLIKDEDISYNGPPKGNQFGICKSCKKQFEQELIVDRNIYSDWKTCPECRKKVAEKKEKKEKEINVGKLPYKPYPWQIEAAEAFETHRFIVLSCGNRTGYCRPLC